MSEGYSRPASAFRPPTGIKVSATPDSLPESRSSYLANVRSYRDGELTSRAQLSAVYSAPVSGNAPVAALEPTQGVYKVGTALFYSGASIATGYTSSAGCSLTQFRPNASPSPWVYAWDSAKASKINTTGGVTVKATGIPEPQAAADFCSTTPVPFFFPCQDGLWTAGGTAGAPANVARLSDTILMMLRDPVSVAQGGATHQVSIAVNNPAGYSVGMLVTITHGGVGTVAPVRAVLPAIPDSQIQAISYFSGTTGHCIVVPKTLEIGNEHSVLANEWVSSLRRGSIVQLGSGLGSEVCYVWSVTRGPTGQVSFETSTSVPHAAGGALSGYAAIQVFIPASSIFVATDPITSDAVQSACTAGVATLSHAQPTPPFANSSSGSCQPNDYIHLSINIDNLSNLIGGKIIFDVDAGAATYAANAYYYSFTVSDVQQAIANTLTQQGLAQLLLQQQLIDEEAAASGIPTSTPITTGSSQWAELFFPLSALVRIGNDQARTLADCQGMQVLFNCSGNVTAKISSPWVSSGGNQVTLQPGQPNDIRYRIRARDAATGAKSNPSPDPRYGVAPVRQQVAVSLPLTGPANADTWDVFRMGGAIDKFRYVGSADIGTAIFYDNYDEAAVLAGDPIDLDCHEPFPTIDQPQQFTVNTLCGTIATVTALGSGSIARYLPGTLVQVGDQNVYTLWTRPVLLSGSTYRFQFVEAAGSGSALSASIPEPVLAAQPLAQAWGPDPTGRIYAVGDALRPGGVYWTNPQNPDGASDQNFKELCSPGEPMVNGCLVNGVSVAFSTMRAWAGYPQSDGSVQWTEIPVGAGLAAQFGIATDGRAIYYVARDGLRACSLGPSQSLTDDDLQTLFPCEGRAGADSTYAGRTVYAPDYSRAAGFRLAAINGYLYFDYQDASAAWHTLVFDTRTKGWVVDIYPTTASIHATSTAQLSGASPVWVGDSLGGVWQEATTLIGGGEPVSCVAASAEFTAGDLRAPKQFGDLALDLLAAGGSVTVTPMLYGVAYGSPTTIAGAQSARQVYPVSLGGQQKSQSLGVVLNWSDQGAQSRWTMWQPAYYVEPEPIIMRMGDPTTYGLHGMLVLGPYLILSYAATDVVTITITPDQRTPAIVTAPSTAGDQVRAIVPLPPLKGLQISYAASSPAKFQVWEDDCEVLVRPWGEPSRFSRQRLYI